MLGFSHVKDTSCILILKVNDILKTFHLCFWNIEYYPLLIVMPIILRTSAGAGMLGVEECIGHIYNENGNWAPLDLHHGYIKNEEGDWVPLELHHGHNVETHKEKYNSLYEEMNGPIDPNDTCEEKPNLDSSNEELRTIKDILRYDWKVSREVENLLENLSIIEKEYFGCDYFDKDFTEALNSVIKECMKTYSPSNIFLERTDSNTFYQKTIIPISNLALLTKNPTLINFISIYVRDWVLEQTIQQYGNPDIEWALERRVKVIDEYLAFELKKYIL
jgi:hypothetical protein